MHSIRFKIIAITVFAILMGILSVTLASSGAIHRENARTTVRMMQLLGRDTQNSVEEYLQSIEQAVEMAANFAYDSLDSVTLVENGAAGTHGRRSGRSAEQTAAVDAYLADYCAAVRETFSSVAGHTRGVVTYYYCIDTTISETEHGFFYSRVGKTGFVRQPPLVAGELDPEDIEHTTWYYTPIERGRPSWVGPYPAYFLGELWTYSYLVPIYKAGTLIGVMGMDIPFETLTEQLREIKVYDSGYACLFSENGEVLYHPMLEIGSMPEGDAEAFAQEVLGRSDSGDELSRYESDGETWLMYFTTLSNGMKLTITAPEREITASWTRMMRNILIAAVSIVTVFFVVLLLVMRILTSPLQRLTAASRRLADGDYDVKLDYRGQDEVGMLTAAFSQMRDRIRAYIEDLNHRVCTDALTELPNIKCFFKLAEAERARLREAGRHPVLLYFNLNGMKYYNRQYGFEEGDRLLQSFAALLTRYFEPDCLSRFGLDHFAAISEEAGLDERLRAIFEECRTLEEGRMLSVRVGVYRDEMEQVQVNNACDRAKYACDRLRGSHTSGYCVFDQEMLKLIQNTRYIIDTFDRAMREHWIQVYYQPIIRAANGRVCDKEALSRWVDPGRGVLPPSDYIPILENSKLICTHDLYVLDQVLKKLQAQKRAGFQDVPQSLNLSRMDFDACDMVTEVCKRVDAAGIPHEKLSIEITESVIGSDFEFMKEQVRRFRDLGFPVWMDDFGSGYSALDVLQDIRFDLLKLDMRFMQRFEESNESPIILTEIIRMAIALGVDTVAEGVETREQADFLREVGCTKQQGYYYCKPISAEEIAERYRTGKQIGFENLKEADYYTALGKLNLYDLDSIASDSGEKLTNFFDTLPMAVIESDGEGIQIIRCNRSYREFMQRAFREVDITKSFEVSALKHYKGDPFARAVIQCEEEGARQFIRETLPNGAVIHALIRHVASNPVTGVYACIVAVLAVTDAGKPE